MSLIRERGINGYLVTRLLVIFIVNAPPISSPAEKVGKPFTPLISFRTYIYVMKTSSSQSFENY